jgi:chromosome transmission fidelity protein 18
VAPKALSTWCPPSSPPVMAMVQESSPMATIATARDIYPKYNRRLIESPRESQHNFTSRVGPFIVDDDDSSDESRLPTSQRSSRSDVISISGPPDDNNDLDETRLLSLPTSTLGRKVCSTGKKRYSIQTCSGKSFEVRKRLVETPLSLERLISSRSPAAPGRARKSYYGVDIHKLLDKNAEEARMSANQTGTRRHEDPSPSVEVQASETVSCGKTLLWTEKYRAKTFTDLIGDERTHRSVLRWFKGWDPIVFPRQERTKVMRKESKDDSEERGHRKILLLTGPPGLGKTTLAHVAARQAGYEVLEINASDERSESVVRGRIRDSLGTENVKIRGTKSASGKFRKAGKPVCIVVDEVDGVVSGASGTIGGGEGGFIKALLDLVALDERNSPSLTTKPGTGTSTRKKKKVDNFRFLRPLVLICNDFYHPSLRPLRQSSATEIIHVRKPPLNMVISRMKTIFEKEGFPCDGDGVRRLCEATWGLSGRREVGSVGSTGGEGDIRRVMVVGEWVAGKLRSSLPSTARLTRKWVERHILGDLSDGGTGARGLGRGGYKEIVQRVFLEGAGLPKPTNLVSAGGVSGEYDIKIGVSEFSKRRAMGCLREMVESGGECDRVITGSQGAQSLDCEAK